MAKMFIEGGFPMWFLLAFGLATLIHAVRYARAPTTRLLRTALGLGAATGFTALTGVAADVAAVGHHAPAFLKAHPEMSLADVLLQGLAESMSPAILGFTMLSLTALLLALGFWRDARD